MTRGFVVAALLLAAAPAAAADDERAFVELTAPRETYYVGEPIRLRLRFGVDTEFLRTNAVPLFQRELDLPVQVDVPAFRGLSGAAPADGSARLTFALNDGASDATPADALVRGGRTFTVCGTERTLVAGRAGDIEVAAPTLRFAFATRFDDGDIRGRVPLDRQDVVVTGRPSTIRVLPLPDAGRPPEFAGAIGRFDVRARTDTRDVVVGVPFRLTLHIEGDGNLETLTAPRLDGLDGFHVLGGIDDHSRGLRTITYDIAVTRGGVDALPPIRFAFFDTTPPAQYRVVATPPMPIAVHLPPGSGAAGTPLAEPDAGGATTLVVVAAVAAVIVAALIAARRRAAAREHADAHPVRTAMARLRGDVATGDPGAAFAAFLGACLGVPAAAVIAPDLAARLASAGLPSETATRAAALLDGLVAARYGGGPPAADARAAVLARAGEIEAALCAGSGRRGDPASRTA